MPLGTRCGACLSCLLSTYYFNDSIMTTDETLDKSFFSPPAAAQELSRTFCILCLRLVCRASVSHNLAFVCAEERGILALSYSCRHVSIGVTLLQVNTEIREISRGLVYQPAPPLWLSCRSLLIGGDQQRVCLELIRKRFYNTMRCMT